MAQVPDFTVIPEDAPLEQVASRARDPYSTPCAGRKETKTKYDPDGDDPDWRRHVRETFEFRPAPRGWVYVGDCPRCCHEEISEPVKQIRALDGTIIVPITLACNCTFHHDGPDDTAGCGRYGVFQVSVPVAADRGAR